jgi:hypothetical protein
VGLRRHFRAPYLPPKRWDKEDIVCQMAMVLKGETAEIANRDSWRQ